VSEGAAHRCVTCPQLRAGEPRIYERAQCCEGCRSRLSQLLREIMAMHTLLPIVMVPGQSQGQRVSGSRTPPLPLRVDPLDLTLPARAGAVHDVLGDQIGHLSVATVLDSWVRDWSDTLRIGDQLPGIGVGSLVLWLRNRLTDACDTHGAIDVFAFEIRNLHRTLRVVTGLQEIRPEHLDVPCRRCDLLDLHRLPGQDRVECLSCGDLLTEEEFHRWCGLLAADLAS